MPAAQTIGLLRSAPLQKVTVAKEVVRLVGDVEGDAAWRFLAEFVDRHDLHKDVRIAVLRALWSHLEREDVWDIFAKAATEDAAAARATVYLPRDRLSKAARARLVRHMELLLGNESAVTRLATVKRLAALPVSAAGTSLVRSLAILLGQATEEEARYVATALILCAPLEEAANLAQVFAENRSPRTLQAIVAALVAQDPGHPKRVEPVSRLLVDALLVQGRQITLAMRLGLPGAAAGSPGGGHPAPIGAITAAPWRDDGGGVGLAPAARRRSGRDRAEARRHD
jgi:hypothetical protein